MILLVLCSNKSERINDTNFHEIFQEIWRFTWKAALTADTRSVLLNAPRDDDDDDDERGAEDDE